MCGSGAVPVQSGDQGPVQVARRGANKERPQPHGVAQRRKKPKYQIPRVHAMTAYDAQAYRTYLLAHGRGRSAVDRAIASLRLFFSMCDSMCESGARLYPTNPFDAVTAVPRPPRGG